MRQDGFRRIVDEEPRVINIGLKSFAAPLQLKGMKVIQVDWKPPAGGDLEIVEKIDDLLAVNGDFLAEANRRAVGVILAAAPKLIGVGRALDVIPGMRPGKILHAGPPLRWESMSGPMRGGVIGGLIYEGLASNRDEAEALLASGSITFAPCHHHGAVGPMAGIITPKMPVCIFRNEAFGNYAYATFNEGLGKVLRYGAFAEEVIQRLVWMENVLAPIMAKAVAARGPIDMKLLIAQALQMGDEGHNRNRAGTSLFIREIAPWIVKSDASKEEISQVLSFLDGNDHFFLNLAMGAAKCSIDPARGIEGSSVIVAMARNGTEFGLRVSGLGEEWFTAPAPMVEGLYLPGFDARDAAPDIGDSVIMETIGLGGMAMAAAPAIVRFVGGSPEDAIATTIRMFEITVTESDTFKIPLLGFRGTPTGIDLVRVIATGILPVINTGIAHREPGIGMIGAGLVKPPMECFIKAAAAFLKQFGG